ncbi:MAG: hypothetical protein EYC70_15855 [Planctomycetota bacterium]|nr:MAG: hypothetical protein EYC70_15855 [Planctomycetota bacterium]
MPTASGQGTETRINTFTSGRQQDPALAANSRGQFLVTWSSGRQGSSGPGIYAQMVSPTGALVGTEFLVNQDSEIGKFKPAVAFAPDDSAWVVWRSLGQDGSEGAIVGRRFGPTGPGKNATYAPLGDESLLNLTTDGLQETPAVAVNRHGTAVVLWISYASGRGQVMARAFDGLGAPVGGERPLGESDQGDESVPVIAEVGDGRFVAVWSRTRDAAAGAGIHGRYLSANGVALGAEFTLSTSGGFHVEPAISSDGRDRFVVAWMSSPDSDEYAVTARLYSAKHGALTAPIVVDAGGSGYRTGAIAVMRDDGTFVVAYNDNPRKQPGESRPVRPTTIRARAYNPDATPFAHDFRVNRFDEGEQTLQVGLSSQRSAWTEFGQLAVVWHGNTGDDSYGIGLSLFQPPMSAQSGWPGPSVRPLGPPPIGNGQDGLAPSGGSAAGAPGAAGALLAGGGAGRGTDFGFMAISDTGWYPPDPDLAVGPNHIVCVVNGQIAFFDKAGINSFRQTLQQFWSSVGANSFVFDPQVLYDPLSGRFCALAAEHASNGADVLDIAVSDDSDPNGTWYKYRFDFSSVGDFIDFPNLGVGADAFYVAADNFGFGGNYIYTFPKAPMLTGSAVTPKTKQTAGGSIISMSSTLQYDAAAPAQYFTTAFSPGSPNLRIYALTNPLGTQVLQSYTLNVGSFSGPPDAQQSGTSNRADTIDVRTKNGVLINGRLYTCHNVASLDGQSASVRWYEIDLRGWPTSGQNPALLQSGRINPGSNIDTWFGSISADSAGNIALAYNRSSPNELISVERTFRVPSDPPGTMLPGTQQQVSTSPETGSRWGDYSGIEIDPIDGSFWNSHEYRTSGWRVWIANFDVGGGGGSCGGGTNGIVLSGPNVGFAGSSIMYTWTSAPASSPWWFYYSLRNTGTIINGHQFDIGSPFFTAGTGTNDAGGNGSFTGNIPNGAAGRIVYLEVRADDISGNSCDSNMLTLNIF